MGWRVGCWILEVSTVAGCGRSILAFLIYCHDWSGAKLCGNRLLVRLEIPNKLYRVHAVERVNPKFPRTDMTRLFINRAVPRNGINEDLLKVNGDITVTLCNRLLDIPDETRSCLYIGILSLVPIDAIRRLDGSWREADKLIKSYGRRYENTWFRNYQIC
jgi:hypothetical protein